MDLNVILFFDGTGQLTSEQIQQEDMLRKAWNAEGSPFKCQPFDPSILHS